MKKPTILCVDDEVDNVDALERLFRRQYHVLRATSGLEALGILAQSQEPVAVILTDQRMPEMTGVEFLEKTLMTYPDAVRILLTGYTDLDSVIQAVNKGQIYRYLTKPWDPADLTNTVFRAVERFHLGEELKEKNRHLEEAYRELKSLDLAKSNFMILINHELKTPLTSIVNFLGLLSESKLDPEQTLYVDRIQKASDRLKVLIEDVLLVVKSEVGLLKADIRSFTPGPVTSMLSPDIQRLAEEKSQTLKEIGNSPAIQTDPAFLSQVLSRLVHNAIKFGEPGRSIEITIEPSEQRATFSVKNYGPPISKAAMDKIFRPFFLDEDIMNHSMGVGLGLTICQALLSSQGSSLQVTNLPDGVKTSFQLPLSELR